MTWRQVGRVLAETLLVVVVDPVREGVPRPRGWPRGLGPIALVALGVYALLGAVIAAAPLLRMVDPLVGAGDGAYLGRWTITVLLWVTTLVVALAVTALLHVHHAARWIGLLVLSVSLLLFVATRTSPADVIVGLVGLLGIWVLALARLGRRFAAVEFAVALVLVSLVVLAPTSLRPALGVDLRGGTLSLLLSSLFVLAMPALMMAGFAFCEVTVSLAESLSDRLAAHGSLWVLRAVAGLAAVVELWRVVTGVAAGEWDLRAASWAYAAGVLAVVAALAALLLGIGRRSDLTPPRATAATGRWRRLAWPLSLLLVINAVPVHLVAVAVALVQLAGGDLHWLSTALGSTTAVATVRLVTAVVGLALAGRAAGRGDRTGAVVLGAFAVGTATSAFGMATGGRLAVPFSPEAAGALLAAAALAVAVARWRTPGAWAGALGVLLLTALYPARELLSDPSTVIAGVSVAATLFLGLVWRLLTDGAQFARAGTRAFPLSSRVLLYLANGLFGAIALAYAALVRTHVAEVDVEAFSQLGDRLLGTPLFLAVCVLGILTAATAHRRPPRARVPAVPPAADFVPAPDAG